VARYYFLSENFDEAFKVLNNNKSANPYLYTSEILKSEMFSYLKVNDSALYYAKKCFVNMPNNPFYFETTAKQLKLAGLQDSILSYYSKIPDKMQLVNFKTILAIFVSDSASVNPKLIDIATEARILYPEDTNIQVLSDYILSGSLNVQKAVQLATDASKLIEQQSYEKAASMYIEAANLNKNDYTYFENAGYTLNLLNKHEEAVSYLQKVVDSLNPGTGKSEYLLGVSLNQLGKTEQACNYLRKAVKMNFKPAYQDFSKYCQ
jgi:tetratricopeptide (TPR) repeat protein